MAACTNTAAEHHSLLQRPIYRFDKLPQKVNKRLKANKHRTSRTFLKMSIETGRRSIAGNFRYENGITNWFLQFFGSKTKRCAFIPSSWCWTIFNWDRTHHKVHSSNLNFLVTLTFIFCSGEGCRCSNTFFQLCRTKNLFIMACVSCKV